MKNIFKNSKSRKLITLSELETKVLDWLNTLPQLAEQEKDIAENHPKIYKEILRPTIDFLTELNEIVQKRIKKEVNS